MVELKIKKDDEEITLVDKEDIENALDEKVDNSDLSDYYTKSQSNTEYSITVEKQSTADTGFFSTYVIKQNDIQKGVKINVPKDFLVKSTTVKTCNTANFPVSGYEVGDKYIDFVINSKDSTDTDEHLYLATKEIGAYPVDEITLTVDNGKLAIKNNGVTWAKLATAVQNTINGKEVASNKVTSVSASSTDVQYPSAKCVYDTFCQGNDPRLSDARTPTSHTHSYLPLSGGTMSGVIQYPQLRSSATVDNIPYAGVFNWNTNILTTLKERKSLIGTTTDGTNWWSVISVRHRNGTSDGNTYGMHIRAPLTAGTAEANANLYWQRDLNGVATNERILIDNENMVNSSVVNNVLSRATNNQSTTGWFKILTIKIQNGYADSNIKFSINRRSKPTTNIELYFQYYKKDSTSSDFYYKLGHCYYDGQAHDTWVKQTVDNVGTGTFDVYIYAEAWADTSITPVITNNDRLTKNHLIITPVNTFVTSLPSGCIQAVKNPNYVADDDSRLSDSRNPKFVNIGANNTNPKDLDDYTTGGFYYCSNDGYAPYISNCPKIGTNNKSFFLLVETWEPNNTKYLKQTLTYYNNGQKTYIRVKQHIGGWSPWHLVKTTEECILSTHTTSTSDWTGKSNHIVELEAGTVIYYYLQKAPTTSDVTLNLTLANGNSTGAKNVYFGNGVTLTNQFKAWSIISLFWDGYYWYVINPYNNIVVSNSLTDSSTVNALSANQGKALNDRLNAMQTVATGNITTFNNQYGASGQVSYIKYNGWVAVNYYNLTLQAIISSNAPPLFNLPYKALKGISNYYFYTTDNSGYVYPTTNIQKNVAYSGVLMYPTND